MILARDTGWTPDVLAELPARFRAACHWSLYAERATPILQDAEAAATTTVAGASTDALRAKVAGRALADEIRPLLFPEDEGV